MFSLLRDLFAYIVSLSALVFTVKIGSFNENLQHAIVIILPLLFIVIHELIVRKF
ncbi:hypothetical protein COI_2179 [Mannheimia haemolytica serotype A2 str. OVINE]|nr:hypothetical protein [Mannheimia haemolytica]EEY09211.1 hypothetical protein COI_2179 [Mannheimia haemolytica serotype A2 str. OVINE]